MNSLISIHKMLMPRLIVLAYMAVAAVSSHAQEITDGDSLADLSLEELLSTRITTLSRKAENIGGAPAAVHVISQSDIRRSGARSIPELLRQVPGMQVAQIDGNKWAVTARGANGRFANKLLVLMDGRTVYNPMLSGVQWDVQDTDIAAIERVEVIRGPGATMWGSNAVNGIVNIITKHAADTQGGNLAVLGGQQGYEGIFRYGANFGESAVRLYGKFFDRDGNVDLFGGDVEDHSEMIRIGGRYDHDGDDRNELTLSFEAYEGESGEYRIMRSLTPPYESPGDTATDVSGGFVMARWSRDISADSALEIRAYFDTHERNGFSYDEDIETFDFDIQHGFAAGDTHSFMWGLSYRISSDETAETFLVSILPPDATRERTSAFIQDQIAFLDGRARFIVGSKFEHNQFGDEDIEIEPSARFALQIAKNQTVWASVSKAVRMPSRGEQGGRAVTAVLAPGQPDFALPLPTVAVVTGNPDMAPEDVKAFELGYRMRDSDFQLDVALFYNELSNLRSLQMGPPVCVPGGAIVQLDPSCLFTSTHVEAPLAISNGAGYDAMGAEIWVSKQLNESWQVQGSYTYFHTSEELNSEGQQQLGVVEDSPDHQLSVRSSMDLSDSLELDLWLRWVDELEAQQVDSYTALDLRFAWAPTPTLSVAAVGRNIFAGDHVEFMSELVDLAPVQIETEAFVELRWHF